MVKKFFYMLAIVSLFAGCEYNSNKKKINKNIVKQKDKLIKGEDFNITFKNSKLVYPKNRMILLFANDSLYSKEEEKILKRLNIKFHKTENKFLANYFKIKYYPSIVVLDKNKTVIYQNFMPYEMIKTQGF